MTVCNMSIEAGAKAGLIAPDDTTFAYLEGRRHAPKGAAWERALDDWRTLPTDDGAAFDKEVALDAAGVVPHVSWGTNPGQVAPITGRVPDPDALRRPLRARGRPPGARVHGPGRRHARCATSPSTPCSSARAPTAGSRTCGRWPPSPRAARSPPACGRWSCPARCRQGPGRGRGPRPDLHGGRVRMARARLLDVPGHEPRQARARRALRLHQQPQLRRPPGPRRAHPPGLPRRRRRHRDRRHVRHPGRPGSVERHEPGPHRQGTAVPLDRSDVDTDQIIPAAWLKRVERTGFGRGLFATWRDDRDFVLNDERYAGATILVAGPNFGTGSSREHAVWAIVDYGFAAVVSPRFGDIFRNNATKNGLVPVVVPPDVGEALLRAVEADPGLEITIDVERRTLSTARDPRHRMRLPARRRHPRAVARGPRRHRDQPAARGGHRRLRGPPPRLDADRRLIGAPNARRPAAPGEPARKRSGYRARARPWCRPASSRPPRGRRAPP